MELVSSVDGAFGDCATGLRRGCFLVVAPGASLSSELEKTLRDLTALLESTFPCFSSQALEEEVSGLSA